MSLEKWGAFSSIKFEQLSQKPQEASLQAEVFQTKINCQESFITAAIHAGFGRHVCLALFVFSKSLEHKTRNAHFILSRAAGKFQEEFISRRDKVKAGRESK